MFNINVAKVNDRYIVDFMNKKFNCKITPIQSKVSKGYNPAFSIGDKNIIIKEFVGSKRMCIYESCMKAILLLHNNNIINDNDMPYYKSKFQALYDCEICYS